MGKVVESPLFFGRVRPLEVLNRADHVCAFDALLSRQIRITREEREREREREWR